MNKVVRKFNILNNNDDLELLFQMNNFPISMQCVDEHEKSDEDVYSDMKWMISKTTGIIQLQELIPLDILYSGNHGSGVIGSVWSKHHCAFAKFINKFIGKIDIVLEIGGQHGELYKNFVHNKKLKWIMVEPNPSIEQSETLEVIDKFYDEDLVFPSKEWCSLIVHSHVLEHIYWPTSFLNKIHDDLAEDGLMVFSIPNMEKMLNNKYTNCIDFEHTIYLTEEHIEFLLISNGFKIVAKDFFMSDHSIFYCCQKSKNKFCNSISIPNLYNKNRNEFNNFITYYKNEVDRINNIINDSQSSVYLFGAQGFSQYLMYFGLNDSKILFILDNDSNKHDKRLYGTNLIIKSPRILSSEISPIIILKCGAYNNEIKQQIINEINNSAIFIE